MYAANIAGIAHHEASSKRAESAEDSERVRLGANAKRIVRRLCMFPALHTLQK